MAFQKGKSGNPGGRPKDKPWSDALRLAALSMDGDQQKLRRIAEKCVAAAMEGDLQAIKEIGDRLDGKPMQSVDMTVVRSIAKELSDDELADIAVGSGEGTANETVDPSQLN